MRSAILAALALFIATPAAAQSAVDCSAPANHADMMACAGQTAAEAEGLLAEGYGAALAIAGEADQAAGAGQDGLATALTAAQADWATYRDAECRVAYLRTGGGQASDLEALGCRAILARARLAALQDTVDALLLIR